MAGLTANEVMDEIAVLLKDPNKVTWTYTTLPVWLKRAMNVLTDELAVNSIKLLDKSATSTVAAGATTLTMPADSLLPEYVEERESGSSVEFSTMTEVDSIPGGAIPLTGPLSYWAFQGTLVDSVPVLNFYGSSTAREVRINYRRFLPYSDIASGLDMATRIPWNTKRFLSSKAAEFIARFILKDQKRMDEFKEESAESRDRLIRAWVRSMQSNPVRTRRYRRF